MNSYSILGQVIGKGSFGVVKLGLNKSTGMLVAIKIEAKSGTDHILAHEHRIIQGCTIPSSLAGKLKTHCFWEDKQNYYLALDLLGPSIDSLHKLCSRSFSLKTTLMLSMQMIDLLEYYHRNDVLHRDIKPSNFLVDFNIPHRNVYLIDFGLAKKHKIKGVQIPYTSGVAQVGSLRYMSKHTHSCIEPSCRDDLYSLGYCVIFLFTGMLPWQLDGVTNLSKADRKKYIGKLKHETSNADLVQNCKCISCETCSFKSTMLDYFNYLDTLEYETPVDYKKISDGIRECFTGHGFIYDYAWDWNKYYTISSASTGI